MATPGQLVGATARALGLPENAVATPWRALREAGEVTVGGRGVHAAHVTMADAAKLFVAVAAASPLKSTLESWREYSQMRMANPSHMRMPGVLGGGGWPDLPKAAHFARLRKLRKSHTFLDALTALMLDLCHESAREYVGSPARGVSGAAGVRLHGPSPVGMIYLWHFGRDPDEMFEVIYLGPGNPDFREGGLVTLKEIKTQPLVGIAQFVAPPVDA